MRLIDADGRHIGVVPFIEALRTAREAGLDLIEISSNAVPPVAKVMDYGRFRYEQKKRERMAKSRPRAVETKGMRVKIGTGERDLEIKAKKVSEWLFEGNRVKVELFLPGRTKYLARQFLIERLQRFLNRIAAEYKIADPPRRTPKGLSAVIERDRKGEKKRKDESQQVISKTAEDNKARQNFVPPAGTKPFPGKTAEGKTAQTRQAGAL